MHNDWNIDSLENLIEVKHGFAFQGEFIYEEPRGNILLTPGNFAIGGGFKGDKFKYYDGPVPNEFILNEADLIITMTDLSKEGDTLGYPALIPKTLNNKKFLHNQRLGKVTVKNPKKINIRYLYYVLHTKEYRHEILASATGTTVKHTSPKRIQRFKFPCAPLPEQRAIAHILGSLDDKIELNRKMNQTLEEMAHALFKSWFVDFDPVRAKAEGRAPVGMDAETAALFPDSFENSELGEIPKGWHVGFLGHVAIQFRRGIQAEDIDPTTPYIALEHMPKRCIALDSWDDANDLESNKHQFQKGEILFGKLRPYFHKVGIAPIDGVCSTDIVVADACNKVWFGFVLEHMSSEKFVAYTNSGSIGTKMPRTSWNEMARYQIVIPPEKIAEIFNEITKPLFEKIIAHTYKSKTLTSLRNTLLPQLISGKIKTKGAEQFLKEHNT